MAPDRTKCAFFVTFLVKRLLHLGSVITFVVKAYYIFGRYYIRGFYIFLLIFCKILGI